MRLLCIYKHYWPDVTPYARLLRAIAERLVEEGHEVTVFTAQPGYNDVEFEQQPWRETLGGVDVIRAWLPKERKRFTVLRILTFALFLLRSIWHAFCNRRSYDVAMFNVHPPMMMGIAGRTIKAIAGITYIYHCQDIHPESARAVGKFKSKFLYNLLRRIDTKVCQNALRNVVLSEDMKNTHVERGVAPEQISVINNFRLQTEYDGTADVPVLLKNDGEHFNVLFAGNIGNYQSLDVIVEAWCQLQDTPSIRLIFMGAGLAKPRLIEAAGDLLDKTVFFLPQSPVEVAFASMQQADLGLVTLAPDVFRVAYPSKTMMYLAAGCPMLTIVESESELSLAMRDLRLGYVCSERDASSIATAVRYAYTDRDQWSLARREELRKAGEAFVGKDQILNRWVNLADELFPRDASKPTDVPAPATKLNTK